MTKVTYTPPNDPGFPASTVWNGITFIANVPVDLDPNNKKHGYDVPVVKRWIDPVSQESRSKAADQWTPMIEIAKTHPHFTVEGEAKVERKVGRPRIPKTSEEYRAHALAWIDAAEDHDELAQKFNSEEALRERCGVGDDDISYIQPHFDAKHRALKQQAA